MTTVPEDSVTTPEPSQDISSLLQLSPVQEPAQTFVSPNYGSEQMKDPDLEDIFLCLQQNQVPIDPDKA